MKDVKQFPEKFTVVVTKEDAKMPFNLLARLKRFRSSSVPMNPRPNNAANSNS